jgi:hypothetical protein
MSEALLLEEFTGSTRKYYGLDEPTATAVENRGFAGSRYVTLGPKEFFWTSAMSEQAPANWSFAAARANRLRLIFRVSAIEQSVSTNWSKQFVKDLQLRLIESHFSSSVFDNVSAEINKDLSIEATFRALAELWRKETLNSSDIRDIVEHDAYRRIISLGWPVVGLILSDLREEPDFWFEALAQITGEDPLIHRPEILGDVQAMADCWLEWGENNGF